MSGRRPVAQIPHGTTVLGLRYADGVIVAGDRRATAGYAIADDKMRKVFAADDYSAIAIAGVAGMAIEMVKLFQLELEHYEKLTGDRLSLEGKANRLAQMIRENFPLAMQGLVVVPLFGGYDAAPRRGPPLLLRRHRRTLGGGGLPVHGLGQRAGEELVEEALEAGPVARGGPTRRRGGAAGRVRGRRRHRGVPTPSRDIYPTVLTVTADGAAEVPEDEVAGRGGRRSSRSVPRPRRA